MKKLLLIAVLFGACKKENKTEKVTVTVLESGTTIPVSGSYVILWRDNYPRSSLPTFFFFGETDENGMVQIDAEDFKSGTSFQITKDKYWNFTGAKKNTLYVTPEGWLKLRLHPVRSYPDRALNITIYMQDNSNNTVSGGFTADTDSTVLLRAFGGVPNKIVWEVHGATPDLDTNGTISNLPVPRLDTLRNITLAY